MAHPRGPARPMRRAKLPRGEWETRLMERGAALLAAIAIVWLLFAHLDGLLPDARPGVIGPDAQFEP